jgi:hypothetical protein
VNGLLKRMVPDIGMAPFFTKTTILVQCVMSAPLTRLLYSTLYMVMTD